MPVLVVPLKIVLVRFASCTISGDGGVPVLCTKKRTTQIPMTLASILAKSIEFFVRIRLNLVMASPPFYGLSALSLLRRNGPLTGYYLVSKTWIIFGLLRLYAKVSGKTKNPLNSHVFVISGTSINK